MSDKPPRITVNGQLISEEAITFELSRLLQFYSQHMPEEQVRAQLPALKARAVEQAIGAKLLIDEAARLDIQVPDDDVDQRLEEMVKRVGGREKFDALLKKQHLNEAGLRDQIRRGRRVDQLVERVVSDSPDPTAAEIRAHFDAHLDEYTRPERVLAQHILIKPADATDAARKAARGKLDAIRTRVQAGANFSDEAAEHSECPSGKEGGSLGWFARGMMVQAFDHAAFAMAKGELSDVIETQFGYHVIYKTDHEDAKPGDFDEAHENVRDFLRHARRGEALSTYVDELRSKAKIVQEEAAAD